MKASCVNLVVSRCFASYYTSATLSSVELSWFVFRRTCYLVQYAAEDVRTECICDII